MKKFIFISLFIFWAAVTAVLTAGLVSYESHKNANGASVASDITTTSTNGATAQQLVLGGATAGKSVTLNMVEISKHNNASNCWLLISGRVYNVTSYLNAHPGGAVTIVPTCGTDATKDYQTKDEAIPSNHSQNARALLANYYVGDFNQVLNQQKIDTAVNKTNSVKPTSSGAPSTPSTPPQTPTQNPAGNTSNSTLTMAELAKHNSTSDCWLLISGKIYNVTSYLQAHPGGVAVIAPTCGTDATAAYDTKGGRGNSHSANATSLLANYYIGDLNQSVTQQQLNNAVQQTNTVPLPVGGGEEEFEDN